MFRNLLHNFLIAYRWLHILNLSFLYSLLSIFSLSYPDPSHSITYEDTQNSDTNWWRVSKPFPEASVASMNYKFKGSCMKGVLKKSKNNGEATSDGPWRILFFLYEEVFSWTKNLLSICNLLFCVISKIWLVLGVRLTCYFPDQCDEHEG